MPRNGSGVYALPEGYLAVDGETAEASQHNPPFEDIRDDLNAPRPIVAGGTGATTAAAARDNLLVSGKVATKSTNYTALTSDRGKVLRVTGDYTVTLTAAATLGDGWTVTVLADGGAVTIDGDASETIDGALTQQVPDGASVTIHCDGTAFYTVSSQRPVDAQCYFQYTDATTCTLAPRNGSAVPVEGRVYALGSSGITLDTTGLSSETLYYVYVYLSSGALTLEASATAWATDADTGLPIKSGDNTRTLVGMLYTNGSTQFTSDMVISYWNPTRRVASETETSALSTTETASWDGIGTPVYFLYFTGFPYPRAVSQGGMRQGAGNQAFAALYLDGTTGQPGVVSGGTSFSPFSVTNSNDAISQGRHYYQLFGITETAGTAIYGVTNVYVNTSVEFWG